jgi:hypothetical protein
MCEKMRRGEALWVVWGRSAVGWVGGKWNESVRRPRFERIWSRSPRGYWKNLEVNQARTQLYSRINARYSLKVKTVKKKAKAWEKVTKCLFVSQHENQSSFSHPELNLHSNVLITVVAAIRHTWPTRHSTFSWNPRYSPMKIVCIIAKYKWTAWTEFARGTTERKPRGNRCFDWYKYHSLPQQTNTNIFEAQVEANQAKKREKNTRWDNKKRVKMACKNCQQSEISWNQRR